MAKMKPEKLLTLFEELAEKMDINIVQGKGDFQGGMCSLNDESYICLLYTSPSPRDATLSRMPSSA